MTERKAIEIMLKLQAEYYYAFKDLPENLYEIRLKNFVEAMDGYSDEEVETAVKILLREREAYPTIANFVEVIERNRELTLPTIEGLWATTSAVIKEIRIRSDDYYNSSDSLTEYRKKQKATYEKLPEEVKAYYIDYENFLDVVFSDKIEIERARFYKNFPAFREREKYKKELKRCKQWTEK